MPQKFQHKRSSTAGVVPTTGQVANGEIAINLADKTIYTNNGSAVVIVGEGVRGSNTQIQFNDSGYANASAGLTFSKSSNSLSVANAITSSVMSITGQGSNTVFTVTGNSAFGYIYRYNKPDGNYLYYSQWDGGNFHHYSNATIYWNFQNSNGWIFNGSGTLRFAGGAGLSLDPLIDGSSSGITAGSASYANSTVTTTTSLILNSTTWAWNGLNGYSISSNIRLIHKQLSAHNANSSIAFANGSTELLTIFTANGNVGFSNTTPLHKVSINGDMLVNTSISIGNSTSNSSLSPFTLNLHTNNSNAPQISWKNSSGEMRWFLNSAKELTLDDPSAGTKFMFSNTGNFGIGDYYGPSNLPQAKLAVYGAGCFGYYTAATVSVPSNGLSVNGTIQTNTSFLANNTVELSSRKFTTTGTTAQTIDSILISTWRSARFFYSAKDNNANAYQTGYMLAIFDGTNTIMTEFSVISTNTNFISWDASANATHMLIQATPTSANTTISLSRETLTI